MSELLAKLVNLLTPKRAWVQFRLRTLFVLTLAIACVCWGYWYLWPAWQDYQERVTIEHAARQLKAGASEGDLIDLLRPYRKTITTRVSHNSAGDVAMLVPVYFRSCWYCMYLTVPPDLPVPHLHSSDKRASREVRIYRLELPPHDYQAQTKSARYIVAECVRRRNTSPRADGALVYSSEDEDIRRSACLCDFGELLDGNADTEVKIEYELIHSDHRQSTDGRPPPRSSPGRGATGRADRVLCRVGHRRASQRAELCSWLGRRRGGK